MHKKALSGFGQYPDPELIDVVNTIDKAMGGNPRYPDPLPPLSAIREQNEKFYTAYLKVKQGAGKEATAIKNQERQTLEDLLKPLAAYVNYIAQGDLAALDSSGFPLSKDHTPVGILPAPKSFTLVSILPGKIDISIAKVDRATGYFVDYRKEGETAYTQLLFTKTKGTLTHLDSVTRLGAHRHCQQRSQRGAGLQFYRGEIGGGAVG